ncbi:MAG TPA: sialidase family protein [Mycobacteriales bacterium]|nr:sialidase family protein [Mycobacteriales bacterium]
MRKPVLAAFVLAATGLLAAGTPGSAAGPAFTKPMRLTEPNFGGYEPSIKVDRHNNIVITAHKANHTILLGKDPHGPVPVRGASFLWHSADAGKTFGPLPGLTAARENSLWPAAEGDFALDGSDRLYFVDTYLGDNSLTRWTMGGPGEVTADFSRPFQGTGSVDDRPWLAAHGNGVVMYLGNAGTRVGSSPASGRYTVYMSYDGGLTFNPAGVNLPDSGWCHGAADPRPKSKRLYVMCTNDGDKLYAYVSDDDGRSFKRRTIGSYSRGPGTNTWPSVSVGRDGTVHALFNLAPGDESELDGTRLVHFSSRDGGTKWRRTDITPRVGNHHYSWLDVASDGTIGVAYYFRPEARTPWVLYGGTARPGKKLVTAQIAEVAGPDSAAPHGDFFQVAFGPDRKLNIAYTSTMNDDSDLPSPDIYYVRQR